MDGMLLTNSRVVVPRGRNGGFFSNSRAPYGHSRHLALGSRKHFRTRTRSSNQFRKTTLRLVETTPCLCCPLPRCISDSLRLRSPTSRRAAALHPREWFCAKAVGGCRRRLVRSFQIALPSFGLSL